MSIVNKFAGFLSKYAIEAEAISTAFKSLVLAVPMNKAERDNIISAVEKFETIPASIEKAIAEVKKLPVSQIKVDKGDVKSAIADILRPMVAEEIAKAIADQTSEQENTEH